MAKVIIRVIFNRRTKEIKELWEFLDIKIFCLAIIIIADTHNERMIKGEDRESENKYVLIKEYENIEENSKVEEAISTIIIREIEVVSHFWLYL